MPVNKSDKGTHWYILYTAPRAEKKACNELIRHQYEVYLPLVKTLRYWSDRKKWVEMPLFNSYIFVYTSLANYYELLNVDGIVKFVTFEETPAVIKQSEIDLIKTMLTNYSDIEATTEKLEPGTKIKVIAGPMTGQQGELIEYKSKKTVMIELQTIGFSLLVQLPGNIIRPL